MRAARIENGKVVDVWEVPSLDCYGDLYTLVESIDGISIGTEYVDGKFVIVPIPVVMPSPERLAVDIRAKRDKLLQETDWSQLSDVPESTQIKWRPYRQALRDIPAQAGFPTIVEWPVAPT